MNNEEIILAPIITEKSMREAGSGKFTFRVSMKADKKKIRQAIEEKFAVDVVGVATLIVKGRSIRVGKRRNQVKVSPYKKAIVKVKQGQKIPLFDVKSK